MSKLNDDELATVRRMIHQFKYVPANGDEWVEAHQKALTTGELVEFRLLETFLSPRPKTSALLIEAAEAIDDLKLGRDTIFGRHWQRFIDQLRDRARAFKDIEDIS